MADIQTEIAAFHRMEANLEAAHLGKWVLIHDTALIDVYASFDEAASVALQRFGREPCLIRQVGAPPMTLPVSVMYHLPHGER